MLSFGRGAVDFARVRVGDYVWKNKDPALDKRLQSYAEKDDHQLVDVRVEAFGKLGDPLEIRITTSDDEVDPSRSNISASGFTASPLVAASNRPIEKADVEKAVGLLGDTPFRLHSLSVVELQKQLFVPMNEIKAARRDAVNMLLEKRRMHNRGVGVDESAKFLPMLRKEAAAVASSMSSAEKAVAVKDLDLEQILEDDAPKLSLLCRTPAQATAACQVPFLNEIVLDFLEVHGLRESVAEVRRAGKVVVVATPRIIKPDEGKLYSFYLRLKADAILVRSAGFLNQLLELGGPGSFVAASNCTIPDLRGDFSLNAANAISAGVFLRNGLQRIAPTHDLNALQICDLARFLAADDNDSDNSKVGHKRASSKIEVILHQHLAVFHTDHCVFARFLSDGNSFRDCGHPCENNHVHLRAMSDGQDHLVLADQVTTRTCTHQVHAHT